MLQIRKVDSKGTYETIWFKIPKKSVMSFLIPKHIKIETIPNSTTDYLLQFFPEMVCKHVAIECAEYATLISRKAIDTPSSHNVCSPAQNLPGLSIIIFQVISVKVVKKPLLYEGKL